MQVPDSLAATADSALTAADSALQAADSALARDSSGIGALNESVGQAVSQLSRGQVDEALGSLGRALLEFTLNHVLPALVVAGLFYLLYRVLAGVTRQAMHRAKRLDLGVQQLMLKAPFSSPRPSSGSEDAQA